jgi:hypothetical protein
MSASVKIIIILSCPQLSVGTVWASPTVWHFSLPFVVVCRLPKRNGEEKNKLSPSVLQNWLDIYQIVDPNWLAVNFLCEGVAQDSRGSRFAWIAFAKCSAGLHICTAWPGKWQSKMSIQNVKLLDVCFWDLKKNRYTKHKCLMWEMLL